MEKIQCIFCKKDNAENFIIENGYTGKKCSQCGLIYISPRPSFDEIINLYGHDQANITAQEHILSENKKRLYAKHHLKLLSEHINKGSILEIGAGAGFFLEEARKLGFEPYAIEFNTIQADFIKNNLKIPCEKSSLEQSLFEGKKFNIIYHCDVLSHFFDPIAEFKKIHNRIDKNGILMFETGNFGDLDLKALKRIDTFQYPDHLFFFSADNLNNLLEITGFEILKVYRYSIIPELIFSFCFESIKNIIRKKKNNINNSFKQEPLIFSQKRNNSKLSLLKNWLQFFCRYKIGYIFPKKSHPQTVLVIARKK